MHLVSDDLPPVTMVSLKEEGDYVATKQPSKIPVTARRPTRKKPKDKPKRPLSAYNFFFKEEREKILKLLAGDKDVENDPSAEDYISDEELNRLRKDSKDGSSKSPKFEELGKLIGHRWKALQPDRLTRYSELASEDTERYKKEMVAYNGRQEAKMRDEALHHKQPPAYPQPHQQFHHQYSNMKAGVMAPPPSAGMAAMTDRPPPPHGAYDLNQMSPAAAAAYAQQQQQAMSYAGYPPMDSYGYSTLYGGGGGVVPGGYGAYPPSTSSQQLGMAGGGGGYPPNGGGGVMMGMPDPSSYPPLDMQQQQAYMGYGGPPPGGAASYPHSSDPYGQGMYGGAYGAAGGWNI